MEDQNVATRIQRIKHMPKNVKTEVLSYIHNGSEYRCIQRTSYPGTTSEFVKRSKWLDKDGNIVLDSVAIRGRQGFCAAIDLPEKDLRAWVELWNPPTDSRESPTLK